MNKIFITILCCISIYSYAERGFLGISIKDYNGKINGTALKGVSVLNIFEGSAALTYNMHENDVIIKIDDLVVTKTTDLTTYLKSKDWGDAVTLQYYRDNELATKKVVLGYQKNKKNYKIFDQGSSNGIQKWYFEYDNTVLYLNNDLEPQKLARRNGDLETTVWSTQNTSTQPIDVELEDKTEAIKTILSKRTEESCVCKFVILEKTVNNKEAIEIKEANATNNLFQIYPNPTSGKFKLDLGTLDNSNVEVNIYDVSGKLFYSKNNFANSILDMDISQWAQGAYLVQVKAGNQSFTSTIVLQ